MNIILSNPIISDFLSQYPEEKHINCLLGIILLGIYNMKTFSIDFNKILEQIETKQSMNAVTHTIQSLKNEISHLQNINSQAEKPEDTPRFHVGDIRQEKRSLSFQKFSEKSSILKKNPKSPYKAFNNRLFESKHIKTPSVVNPEFIVEQPRFENSEILSIADQFLNGRFVSEYCNIKENEKVKASVPKLEINSRKTYLKTEKNDMKSRPLSTGLNSSSHSGRCNSFSVLNNNRSVRGERTTSYSKFW